MGKIRRFLRKVPLLGRLVGESFHDGTEWGELVTDQTLSGVWGIWQMARTLVNYQARLRGGNQEQYYNDAQIRELARLLARYNSLAIGINSALRGGVLGDQGLQMVVEPADGLAKSPGAQADVELVKD